MSTAFEAGLRLSFFVGIFALLAILEAVFPRRNRYQTRRLRWSNNLSLSLLNQVVTLVVIPLTAVALAILMEREGWGLLNLVTLPTAIEYLAAILLLDLTIYWQHRMYHAVPILWRFHRVHHADTDFDVSTGIRFHPISILLSALIKIGAVVLIGPAALAVLIFEVLLNATSLFNHSNFKIVPAVDRYLRNILVTPDMHRVHHSSDPAELRCNFGFNFPWWDHLFGSYLAQPKTGHQDMEIGLTSFRDAREQQLPHLLTQPFR